MPEPAQLEMEYSEAELTGEPSGDEGKAAPSAEPPPAPEPEKEAAKEPEKTPEPEKPPVTEDKRVPLKELIAERKQRQELQAKLAALEAAKTAEPVKTAAELILEDPEEAIRMLMTQNQQLRDDFTRREMEREIKTAVPDFFDKAPQMEELLLGEGFSEEAIRSMIGSVGLEAPKLFKVLDKLVTQQTPESMRKAIAAELTPTITAEVTRALMAKFNIADTGVNIGKLPGSAADGKMAIDSERDFEKLTPEQQEKWLRGEF
jgi:hypothetical protein